MAGITLAQATTALSESMTARTKILNGQAYSVGGRSLTRADLRAVNEDIKFWNAEVKRLTRGGMRVRTIETDTD